MLSVDTLIPLHSRIITVVNAIEARNRVRVKRISSARHGGRRALADFHVIPPLGSSITAVYRR